jgi:hypothetical protein
MPSAGDVFEDIGGVCDPVASCPVVGAVDNSLEQRTLIERS